MNRRELAEYLADKLGVPVAPTPLDPVVAPGLALGPGSPYRQSLVACQWSAGVEITVVAGTMADTGNVFDRCDELVDRTIDALEVGGLDVRSVDTPTERPIGDVVHLVATMQATLP